MLDLEDLAKRVTARFKAAVEDVQSLPTEYDNVILDESNKEDEWARWSVSFGSSTEIALGEDRERILGEGIAQLFGPIGHGTKSLWIHANVIKDAFRNWTDGVITFENPRFGPRPRRDGDMWQINVNCPFSADDVS